MISEPHKCAVTGMQNYKQQPITELNKDFFFLQTSSFEQKHHSFCRWLRNFEHL